MDSNQINDKAHPQGDIVFFRHFLSLGPEILLFIIISLASIYLTSEYPEYVQYLNLGFLVLPLPLFLLAPLVMAAYIIHGLFNYKYIISDDYVLGYEGVLSLKMVETRVEYEHIRGVELDRTLYQRMFNLGDIKIGSSMKNEIEVLIRGIYKPDYYKRIIEYRLRLHMESRQSLL